jgi:hypothetical protein
MSRQHGADDSSKNIVDKTCGMLFLGTPFGGATKARWGTLALNFISWIGTTNDKKMKDLQERSMKLISVNDSFLKFLYARARTAPVALACFFEEYSTYIGSKKLGLIVPKESAILPLVDAQSIPASHSDMCKFENDEINGFRSVSEKLSEWVDALKSRGVEAEKDGQVYTPSQPK